MACLRLRVSNLLSAFLPTEATMRLTTKISSFLFFYSLFDLILASGPQVNLSIGVFEGLVTGNGTEKFLGIPFAQPPVGSLRFKAPIPINRTFSGVQNATTFGNACIQPPSPSLGAPISEDCLFLNVSSRLAGPSNPCSLLLAGVETRKHRHRCRFTGASMVLCA